jgi:hypothetical protein
MSDIITRIRIWLVGLALAFVASPAVASGRGSSDPSRATDTAREATESAPAGSPEFGVLIIIGVVAFLVFVAWLVTRVGDDNPRGGDGSII